MVTMHGTYKVNDIKSCYESFETPKHQAQDLRHDVHSRSITSEPKSATITLCYKVGHGRIRLKALESSSLSEHNMVYSR